MDEKVMILKMLEEGKINSEEALKLLDSIDKTSSSTSESSKLNNDESDESSKFNYALNNKLNDVINTKFNDAINKLSKKAEKIADKLAPEVLDKVENISNDFTEATVKFADKIIDYINSNLNDSDIYKTIKKNYTFPLNQNINPNLYIRTHNLSVSCYQTKNPEIIINVKLKCLFDNNDIEKLISTKYENDSIYFYTDFPLRTWGSVEVLLPDKMNFIDIQTSNSPCYIENCKGNNLKCITSNGKIQIKSSSINSLIATTSNSRINIDHSNASTAEVITSNANIEINDSMFDKIKSFTNNGGIYLRYFDALSDVDAFYSLHTSNGKVLIELPNEKNLNCKIKAITSLGKINISNLNPSYIVERGNENLNAEATIINNQYDSSSKRINIEASTSNSSINIIGS